MKVITEKQILEWKEELDKQVKQEIMQKKFLMNQLLILTFYRAVFSLGSCC